MQTRTIATRSENDGAMCTGDIVREIDCNTQDCPKVDCQWSDWSITTTCSKTCGGGKQLQTRTIVKRAENDGAMCTGGFVREIDCNTQECPRDDIL